MFEQSCLHTGTALRDQPEIPLKKKKKKKRDRQNQHPAITSFTSRGKTRESAAGECEESGGGKEVHLHLPAGVKDVDLSKKSLTGRRIHSYLADRIKKNSFPLVFFIELQEVWGAVDKTRTKM